MQRAPPMAPDNFCALILTHGRPDRVVTHAKLRQKGYTGPIFLVVDDEDTRVDDYILRYGAESVVVICKREIAERCDEGDNSHDRRSVLYARNASFEIARSRGFRYFVQLDDDYREFGYRFDSNGFYRKKSSQSLDEMFESVRRYLSSSPFAAIALGQGGDYMGGADATYNRSICTARKAMNTFFCDSERPFQFVGRLNDDVNTYTVLQRAGLPFLTLMNLYIEQGKTQANEGGLTDLYLDSGTYVKSFYTVMYAPSATRINLMGQVDRRLHHRLNWNAVAPKILPESARKSPRSAPTLPAHKGP